MAKIHLSRLQQKYNFKEGDVKALKYRKLMQDILANESENIAKMTARISNDNYLRQAQKVKDIEKKMILPNIEDVMPKRSVFLRKGAIDGDIMSDTLRDSLTRNLRQTLNTFRTEGGEPAYIRRRGAQAGTINPKVIAQFEKSIKGTFEGYTKVNPKYGMPSNIHTIAVTEIRTTINPMKYEYNLKLSKMNAEKFDVYKEWRQNKMLSKDPRKGHSMVDRKRILIHEMFEVPRMIKRAGKWIQEGVDNMKHPHDLRAHESQTIGCNCDFLVYAMPKK